MRFKQYLLERITNKQLNDIEKILDRLFSVFDIDIVFTKHFKQRINDMRNTPEISIQEILNLYKTTFNKYGKNIANMGNNASAVINDINTKLNVPFVINLDKKNNEIDFVSKTIMRKKNFLSRNKKLIV